ncbi:HpcH/HpaI aldolase/citrate lyase family protein [Usitatibacter palustris]|uniref:(3S)-malyl-CoA thioesterase n=1 Tax=Usitatibacter palustris TaxID=2732487 RepID=A0A6M4H5W0_9PROT|nr:CoA ester lyase [Usitatibacter palustris]QJR14890.1 (3S)-malyl-CoA thioesterase [Usitatibacter palustris]
MNPYFRPRRSMLYVPGCAPRYLNKARTLRVDSVILDLGDPILVEAKEQSRKNVVEAVLAGGYGRREVVVRVNDLESPWGRDDVKAVARCGAEAVLFPNIESKADVQTALTALDAAGGSHLPIMVMVESPIAVLRAEEIASASDRIACIVMATSDLLNQLHGRRTPDRIAVVHSLGRVLLAGRAYDRAVVDGISTDLKDMQAFEFGCRLARDLGFDGKSLVHPFQLPYCNDAFTPKAHDLAAANEVIEALEHANREGRGTVVVNGRLVEGHHVKASKRMLALADMIEKLEAGQ